MIRGRTPTDIAIGERPPDLMGAETADPEQVSRAPGIEDQRDLAINRLAQEAHLRAQPHTSRLRDLSLIIQTTEGRLRPETMSATGLKTPTK